MDISHYLHDEKEKIRQDLHDKVNQLVDSSFEQLESKIGLRSSNACDRRDEYDNYHQRDPIKMNRLCCAPTPPPTPQDASMLRRSTIETRNNYCPTTPSTHLFASSATILPPTPVRSLARSAAVETSLEPDIEIYSAPDCNNTAEICSKNEIRSTNNDSSKSTFEFLPPPLPPRIIRTKRSIGEKAKKPITSLLSSSSSSSSLGSSSDKKALSYSSSSDDRDHETWFTALTHTISVDCVICAQTFAHLDDLSTHLDTMHPMERAEMCNDYNCAPLFATYAQYERHLEASHQLASDLAAAAAGIASTNKRDDNNLFQCGYCRHLLIGRRQFFTHAQSFHAAGRFQCTFRFEREIAATECTFVADSRAQVFRHFMQSHRTSAPIDDFTRSSSSSSSVDRRKVDYHFVVQTANDLSISIESNPDHDQDDNCDAADGAQ